MPRGPPIPSAFTAKSNSSSSGERRKALYFGFDRGYRGPAMHWPLLFLNLPGGQGDSVGTLTQLLPTRCCPAGHCSSGPGTVKTHLLPSHRCPTRHAGLGGIFTHFWPSHFIGGLHCGEGMGTHFWPSHFSGGGHCVWAGTHFWPSHFCSRGHCTGMTMHFLPSHFCPAGHVG